MSLLLGGSARARQAVLSKYTAKEWFTKQLPKAVLGAAIIGGGGALAAGTSLGRAAAIRLGGVGVKLGKTIYRHPIKAIGTTLSTIYLGGILKSSPKAREYVKQLPTKTFAAGKTAGEAIEGKKEKKKKGLPGWLPPVAAGAAGFALAKLPFGAKDKVAQATPTLITPLPAQAGVATPSRQPAFAGSVPGQIKTTTTKPRAARSRKPRARGVRVSQKVNVNVRTTGTRTTKKYLNVKMLGK